MKLVLVATICTVLVIVVSSEDANPIRRCNNGDDCQDGECCVGSMFLRGSCRKRGREGDRCNGDESNTHGKYRLRCPCASGFSCVPEKIQETIFGQVRMNERCKVSASPSPEPDLSTQEERLSTSAPEEES